MKKAYLFNVALLLVSVLFVPASRAQDYTRWNLPEGVLARLGKGRAKAAVYSADGTRLAVNSSIGIWIYDAHTGAEVVLIPERDAEVMALSSDGSTLASISGGFDNTIKLWDAVSGQLKAVLKGNQITSIAFSPDGATLASGSDDNTIRLWDAGCGQLKAILKRHNGIVASVSYSPDGATLASGSNDGTVQLWDADSGQIKDTLELPGSVYSVAYTPDGASLVIVSSHTVAYTPDGASLVTNSDHGTVRLWDVDSGQIKDTLPEHTIWVNSVAFSPDGATLASSHMDYTVRLWDVPSRQIEIKNSLTLPGHIVWSGSVAFSPDGATLASGHGDGAVRLWDVVSSRAELILLQKHQGAVLSVAYSPDGGTLASGGYDGTVRLWDADSGQFKTSLKGHNGPVSSVAYSLDGATLASGSNDDTIRLWDVDSGQLKTTLEGRAGRVYSIAFSPDGAILASGSYDGTILLWDIAYPPVDISVPLGFAVEKWSSLEPVAIDLITNREYGTGIMGATILNAAFDDGEVLLWRYSAGGEELVARIPAKLVNAVPTVRFDQTGLFDNKLFVTINAGPDGHRKTRVVIVEPNGEFHDAINIYDENSTQASIEFISQPSYPAGAYIYDADIGQGQSFYRLDESFDLHLIASHALPVGRSDIDPMDLKADPTGKYGGLLTLSDTDLNHERLSGLYQLQANGEWRTLVSPAPVSERQFQGIAFSNAGPLGSGLYVADAAANNIWIASPRGHIEAFAIGFAAPKRVAIGPEGTDMWVTDQTGLYRIFSTDPSDWEARKATLPVTSGLASNYPNPFNSSTQIPYRVSASGPVRLVIYNALGQPVRTLVDEIQAAGTYQVPWDGRDHSGARVANGVYLYRLQAGTVAQVRKMLVLE